ncbi:Hpt domain-containing protein [Pseudoruegeria sp. SHC-113]|uniref:Hpt domain-containing protein n=1 Tax=Pseudoruegeria sp. SHC-113 TaxID=2855439 RepID=UPI0021BA8A3C|nr:Hpt domain-containing protein [Pseudoruegeria sp. SHC-113]MCT8158560.1 Hpt domain-containing protein [Pseudoruegeria sp. SHC-113]
MIDWNRVNELREEVGPEAFDEVVEIFLEEVDETIQRLRTAIVAESFRADMHFLKGSALNLGFADFAALCAEGEIGGDVSARDSAFVSALFQSYDDSRTAFLASLPKMPA